MLTIRRTAVRHNISEKLFLREARDAMLKFVEELAFFEIAREAGLPPRGIRGHFW